MKTPPAAVQDVAPPGGFPAINVARKIPPHGPSSAVMVAGTTAVFVFGIYQICVANTQRRADRREQGDVRLAIMPFLSAESDLQKLHIDQVRVDKEKEIMKDVSGWDTSAQFYKTRYMKPMTKVGGAPVKIFQDVYGSPWKW